MVLILVDISPRRMMIDDVVVRPLRYLVYGRVVVCVVVGLTVHNVYHAMI